MLQSWESALKILPPESANWQLLEGITATSLLFVCVCMCVHKCMFVHVHVIVCVVPIKV